MIGSVERGTSLLAKRAAKGLFAAADLVMGNWPGPRILIYHNISDGSAREMDLPFEQFTAQIDWLAANGRIIDLEEALSSAGRQADDSYVLTFDDGYLSLYEDVFPVLRDRGLPFTLYLTTEPVETQVGLAAGDSTLNWQQIAEMADSGQMTVGSHTHRHPDLRGLSEGEIAEELDISNQLIREHLGSAPRHFAYPKGYWDPTAERLVRTRYVSAVLGAGAPVVEGTDPYRVYRLPIQRSDGVFFFKRKVSSGMRLEEYTRRKLKGYEIPQT